MFDAFGYDAVFAVAHALHDLIEVQNRTEIVGNELLDTLIRRVSFEGVTGQIDFYDASADPDRLYDGDRRVGIRYSLLNYVNSTQGLVTVGYWTPCAVAGCAWSERWESSGLPFTYSTADNSQPQSGRSSCPYGETLLPNGVCVCDDGFEPVESEQADSVGAVQCRSCALAQYSHRPTLNSSGSSGCTVRQF